MNDQIGLEELHATRIGATVGRVWRTIKKKIMTSIDILRKFSVFGDACGAIM